jgi:hypothetical protein
MSNALGLFSSCLLTKEEEVALLEILKILPRIDWRSLVRLLISIAV